VHRSLYNIFGIKQHFCFEVNSVHLYCELHVFMFIILVYCDSTMGFVDNYL